MKNILLKTIIPAVLIFILSILLRVDYIGELNTGALRGDQIKYLTAAYNLEKFETYSLDQEQPPKHGTDLAPGYPIFLTNFYSNEKISILRIQRSQILLGSLTMLSIFLLARFFFSLNISLIITALSLIHPQIISLEGVVLTETLFIFIQTIGLLTLVTSLKHKRLIGIVLAGILLASSMYIRAVNLLLIPTFIIFFFIESLKQKKSKNFLYKSIVILIVTLCIPFALNKNFIESKTPALETIDGETKHQYTKIHSPLIYLKNTLTPNKYHMLGLEHTAIANKNGEERAKLKGKTETKFSEEPYKYITWLLYGKIKALWSLENAYTETVHVYRPDNDPYIPESFSNSYYLSLQITKLYNWPSLALCIVGIFIFIRRYINNSLDNKSRYLSLPIVLFCYQFSVVYMLSSLPRYTVPLRPLALIIAAYGGIETYKYLKNTLKIKSGKSAH